MNSRTNEREKGGTDETVQSSLEELHSKNETKHTVMEKSYSLEEKRKVARSYSLEQKRKELAVLHPSWVWMTLNLASGCYQPHRSSGPKCSRTTRGKRSVRKNRNDDAGPRSYCRALT